MKKVSYIILFVSLAVNIYFIYDFFRSKKEEELSRLLDISSGNNVKEVSWDIGIKQFKDKLVSIDRNLPEKKYYYINVWTSWCMPCIKEMPWLDSIAGSINKDIAFVFVSDNSEQIANTCITKRKYNIKHFVFMNEMNDFISSIYNKQGLKDKIYPITLIIDKKGNVFHYSLGAYESYQETKELINIINKLPA